MSSLTDLSIGEVSCRATVGTIWQLRRMNRPVDHLTRGLSLSLDDLSTPSASIRWDDFRQFFRNATAGLPRAEFVELSSSFCVEAAPALAATGAWSPARYFARAAGNRCRLLRQLFRCLDTSVARPSSAEVVIEVWPRPGFAAPGDTFWECLAVGFGALARSLGLPAADVAREPSDLGARFRVRLPHHPISFLLTWLAAQFGRESARVPSSTPAPGLEQSPPAEGGSTEHAGRGSEDRRQTVAEDIMDTTIVAFARDARLRAEGFSGAVRNDRAAGRPAAKVAILDRDCRWTHMNPALAAISGHPPDTHIGKKPNDLFTPDLAAVIEAGAKKVMETGEANCTHDSRGRAPTAPDSARHWQFTHFPIPDAAGQVGGIGVTVVTVPPPESAGQLPRAGSDETAEVADAVALTDGDGRLVSASPAFLRMWRYDREDEVRGRAYTEFWDRPDLAAETARAAFRDETWAGELTAVRRDGGRFEARVSHSLVRDPFGRPAGLTSSIRDATNRTPAGAMPPAEVSGAADGNWMWDFGTNQMWWSAGVYRLFVANPGPSPFPVEKFRYLVQPNEWESVQAQVAGVVAGSDRYEHLIQILRPDGQTRWIMVAGRPVRDADRRVIRLDGTVQDVTEQKKLEAQRLQSQKMEALGLLAGGVAHDFNNLLTVINGYAELLLASSPEENPDREAVTAIREAGDRAARLTQQILLFSRRAPLETKFLDLNNLLNVSVKLLRRLIEEDIVLSLHLDPTLARIQMDPGLLEQVIMNLVVNARDAMPTGGDLTIETRNATVDEKDTSPTSDVRPGKYVRLTVSDSGCGMSSEVKAKIFEPFFTTKEGVGTGLGLTVVFGAVKQSGGHMSFDSQVGVGTRVTLLFPVAPDVTPEPPSEQSRIASGGTETVLLVEDEDAVRRVASISLKSMGYSVLEAGGSMDAVRLVREYRGPISLLVTDVVMPEMGGRQLAELIRARHPGLPVLYLSGHTEDVVLRHGVLEEGETFLQKPFTPLALTRKIRATLDGVWDHQVSEYR
ncbi:hybrid sensor histidine kinase/response regulator [Fimbriiglobus ruber]|uniref:histidine kinase n=1 Tax=Fimbriiglobus ruber TaxID=1908690 RepID=A0A225DV60_9BACT|nr:PAS domain-containing protein [Fimbriiglobus ruber]OWK40235.1 sensory box histidine kinase/response regulator [Fimbriiglobus ruber]